MPALVSVDDVHREEKEDRDWINEKVANGEEGVVCDFHVRVEVCRKHLRDLGAERSPRFRGPRDAVRGERLDGEGVLCV